MTIRDAKQAIIQAIEPLYDQREAVNIATLLIEELTGHSKMNQFLQKQALLPEKIEASLNKSIIRLSKGEPIQYVLGKAWFMDMELLVNSNTLIPRPETEELVTALINHLKAGLKDKVQILEIGTGSGCIPIALAKYCPTASITSIDISEEALAIAKKNASLIGVKVEWKQIDFLDNTQWEKLGKFDIIISNPPYIRKTEASTMHTNVLAYEPHTALFVEDNDPLIFYKAIVDFSKKNLKNGGAIFLEINEQLALQTADLFKRNYRVEIKKDMQEKERMIMAYQF
jgi:release factor glutamine methyltransferase